MTPGVFFPRLRAAIAAAALAAALPGLAAESRDLQPMPPFQAGTAASVPVWGTNDTIGFSLPADDALRSKRPLYVRVRYLDEGAGLIKLTYRCDGDRWTDSEIHLRSSRVGTGQFVESFHELKQPAFSGSGAVLRLRILQPQGTPLSVEKVTVQDEPFAEPLFQEVIQEPWNLPLVFPPGGVAVPRSLKGTVMVGYQGWFRTPNDLYDGGWRHWFKNGTPGDYTIDMWPNVSAYPPATRVQAGALTTQSGRPAYLFSSASQEVVDQHFRWMRESHIDGAFLQRFMSHRAGGDDGTPEWVLYAVRKAAFAQQRLWAIEYDVSGLNNETVLEVLKRDWIWLVDRLKITADPCYVRENGRPVVFIWGLPVLSRGFTPEAADAVVDFFKNDPVYGKNYVIGGVPAQWRKQPEWLDHLRRYDSILTWQGREYEKDRKDFQRLGIQYYPHVWPGFSWSHLKEVSNQYTPREGGAFYWNLITQALGAGNDRLFIGMFDEYDEGTAIMPMSDDPPAPKPGYGRFLTNEGRSPGWWLKLTSQAKETMQNPASHWAFPKSDAELRR